MINLKCQKNIAPNSESENLKQHVVCFVHFFFPSQSRGGR